MSIRSRLAEIVIHPSIPDDAATSSGTAGAGSADVITKAVDRNRFRSTDGGGGGVLFRFKLDETFAARLMDCVIPRVL